MQKISVTLSLVIIAYIFCNCLIFTYKVQNICEITNFLVYILIPNWRKSMFDNFFIVAILI